MRGDHIEVAVAIDVGKRDARENTHGSPTGLRLKRAAPEAVAGKVVNVGPGDVEFDRPQTGTGSDIDKVVRCIDGDDAGNA